jgi:hypothetical protein
MTTKINFNDFVKNHSENLSNELYKIMIDEANRRNQDNEYDHWANRLDKLISIISTIVSFNKNLLHTNLTYHDMDDIIKLDYIYKFYQENKNNNFISKENKEKIYDFLIALPGLDFNKTIDEQPVNAFEIFCFDRINFMNIFKTIFE